MESQKVNESANNQEIDLIYLTKKIKDLFVSFCFLIIRTIKFLYRKKIALGIILLLGIALGFYLDTLKKNEFKTEVVVVPNFESIDLLYSEVDNFKFNLKTNAKSNPFLNDITDVKVEPIENITTVLQDPENLEMFKVLSEKGQDLSKMLSIDQFKKSYKYHLITIKTKSDKNTQKSVEYLLNTINQKPYYKNRSKLAIENQQKLKLQTEKSIEQINKILENLGSGTVSNVGKDFNINNYDQLSNVIDLKNYYTKELAKISTRLIEYNSAIYPVDISINNKETPEIYKKFILIIPIAFFILFLMVSYFIYFYHKYNNLYKSKQLDNA